MKPLSSVNGKIERLLITLPPVPDAYVNQYYHELESTFKAREMVIRYRNYEPPRNALRPPTRTHNPQQLEEQMYAVLNERDVLSVVGPADFPQTYLGAYIDALKKGTPIANTEWAQDPFCILHDGSGRSVFLQPLFSRRYMDKFISLQLASWDKLDMLVRPTPLLLEGGNILAGDNFILAGKDTLAQNVLHELKRSADGKASRQMIERIEEEFRRTFGVEHVIWVGFDRALNNWNRKGQQSYQPAFHIDLFMTMGGKDAEGREIIFCGDPRLADRLLGVKERTARELHREICLQFDMFFEFWERYERDRLPGMPEFRIVRVPLYVRHNVLYSFNNCLVERYGATANAYVPDYEVADEDVQAEQLNEVFRILKPAFEQRLRTHGFDTIQWIGPGRFFRKLARMRGALHCITKVLKRSQEPGKR